MGVRCFLFMPYDRLRHPSDHRPAWNDMAGWPWPGIHKASTGDGSFGGPVARDRSPRLDNDVLGHDRFRTQRCAGWPVEISGPQAEALLLAGAGHEPEKGAMVRHLAFVRPTSLKELAAAAVRQERAPKLQYGGLAQAEAALPEGFQVASHPVRPLLSFRLFELTRVPCTVLVNVMIRPTWAAKCRGGRTTGARHIRRNGELKKSSWSRFWMS